MVLHQKNIKKMIGGLKLQTYDELYLTKDEVIVVNEALLNLVDSNVNADYKEIAKHILWRDFHVSEVEQID